MKPPKHKEQGPCVSQKWKSEKPSTLGPLNLGPFKQNNSFNNPLSFGDNILIQTSLEYFILTQYI